MSAKIEQVDKQLKKYYDSLNVPYDRLFAEYCDENGIDDESLAAELEEDADDAIICDFDDDFPFAKPPPKDSERNNQIFALIKRCFQQSGLSFTVSMPEITAESFHITKSQLDEVRSLYKKQCPVLWNSGMTNDQTFLAILAVGRKHNFDYLQHLVGDYFMDRVENSEQSLTVVNWALKNKHISKLKNFNKGKAATHTPAEAAMAAVKAFGARCCPKLLFCNLIQINDSLEMNVRYIVAAGQWINSLIQKKEALPPFQIDLCLGLPPPTTQEKCMEVEVPDENSDDDDDDFEFTEEKGAKAGFLDCIGDINTKLDKNGLKYKLGQFDMDEKKEIQPRQFGAVFKEFQNLCNKEQKGNGPQFPHRKRFVAFIDRRAKRPMPKKASQSALGGKYDQSKDDIWMYQPPSNCRDIPSDAVPEWYISASRTSILPNEDYDVKKAESAGVGTTDQKQSGSEDTNEKLLKANIGAPSHCKGALLTLSFICREEGAITAYLYWNGQITRFRPSDIKNVFPKLFNMEWKDENGASNQQFIENDKEVTRLIGELETTMHDKHFTCFRQTYMGKT